MTGRRYRSSLKRLTARRRLQVIMVALMAALILALICLFLRARVEPGRALRWIALLPAGVALVQILAFAVIFVAASAGVL